MSMVTLNVENALGEWNEVEVSDDYMTLCNMNANYIIDSLDLTKATGQDVAKAVESITSDETQRSVIANMVVRKLQAQAQQKIIEMIFDRLLGE